MLRTLALLATALISGAAAIALIAVIGTRSAGPAAPVAAGGEDARVISAKVLPLRVPDPGGGPPWGLRLVRTSNGLLCVQVGRVIGARFGELAIDGAFNNDGKLHPAALHLLAGAKQPAGDPNNECLEPGGTFSGQIGDLDRSAAFSTQEKPAPTTDLRQVSFGMLGRHAQAITYRGSTGVVTAPVRAPYGAYLIVQPNTYPRYGSSLGAAPGNDDPTRLQAAGLTGALKSIRYRYGPHDCQQVKDGRNCAVKITAGSPGSHENPTATHR